MNNPNVANCKLRVGLIYNLKRDQVSADDDRYAEFDTPKTIAALEQTITSFGYQVFCFEATRELPLRLTSQPIDLAFNIAEGYHGRSREAQVPALLELLEIPYTGSDPATMAICLDKALAKRIVRHAGVPVPNDLIMHTGDEPLPAHMSFPVLVKPATEGSSKGIRSANVAENPQHLTQLVQSLLQRYQGPVLVETYLPGREFTVGVLGGRKPRVLPPMEIVFTQSNVKYPVYSFEHKIEADLNIRFHAADKIAASLCQELEEIAQKAYIALGCRDVARIDLRLDTQGRVNFIECNPLPGLSPGFSDLCLLAEKAGMDYRSLIYEILAPAVERFFLAEQSKPRSSESLCQAPAPMNSPAPQSDVDSGS